MNLVIVGLAVAVIVFLVIYFKRKSNQTATKQKSSE